MRKLFLFLSLLSISLGAFAQASPYNLFVFKAQSFSATGQTGTPIQLNGLTIPSTVGSSYASGTITVTGVALTTVSFQVMGSSDNGTTYYLLPVYSVPSPSASPVTTVTATAAGLYQINLAGLTHIKLLTTGTFTATSVSLTLTGSPNASISKNGSGGGSISLTSPGGTIAVGGTGAAPTIDLDLALANTWTQGMTIENGLTLDTLAFSTEGEGMTFTNGSEIFEDDTLGLLIVGANNIFFAGLSGQELNLVPTDGVNASGAVAQVVGPSNSQSMLEVMNSTSASVIRNTKTSLVDGTNAIEEQFGVLALTSGIPVSAFAPTMAVGNVTTTIANTNVKLVGTVTINGAPPATSNPQFSAINSGTNSTAIMHVGTGASLNATGSGTIDATSAVNLFGTIAGSLPFQLSAGVTGYLSGTGLVKLGGASGALLAADGTDYLSPTSGVVSFKTRQGIVSPASGDYTAAQVTNALDLSATALQTMNGPLTVGNGDLKVNSSFALWTAVIRDTIGGSVITTSAGKATFPNVATFSSGLTVPVGQSVNTPILRDNAGNAVATFASGAATFSNNANFTSGLTIGTGQKMTSPPEMMQSTGVVALNTLGNLSGNPMTMISPITITRYEWQLNNTATGCTTQPQVTVMVNGVASALVATVNLTGFFGHQDTNVNVPAGQNVQIKVTTAEAGCTPATSTAQGMIHYVMQ